MHDPTNLLHRTLQLIRDGVVATDTQGCVQSMNPAAEAMTGWLEAEALGMPIEVVVDLRELREGLRNGQRNTLRNTPREGQRDSAGEGTREARLPSPAYRALSEGIPAGVPGEVLLIARSGLRTAVEVAAAPLLCNSNGDAEGHSPGLLSGAVLVLHDMTEALQLASRRFYLSHHDPLTALPNRILLVDRMEQATKFADRHSDQMAILSLDLDRFTQINEAHGPAAGDALLKEVAFRITGALRESDTVCRLGADDFVILLPGVTSPADVVALAAKLLGRIAEPFTVGGLLIRTTCSIGVSLYPQDAIDAVTLMRLADAALMDAKRGGRNRYAFAGTESAIGFRYIDK